MGYYWPQYYSQAKESNALATIVSSRGTTERISRINTNKKQRPRKSETLGLNDSVATGTDGEMVLRFKKGAEIRLLPSSFVTLIRKANATLLTIRRGEIEIIKEGQANSIFVARDGQDHSLQDYQPKEELEALWIDPHSLDTVKTVEPSSEFANSGLEGYGSPGPEGDPTANPKFAAAGKIPLDEKIVDAKDLQTQVRSMIADRIARQKNHLYRCYENLIQKQRSAEGKIDLHFKVNNLGKAEDPMVVKSEIKDKTFQNCLIKIIQRTDFQAFQGQKVSTFLPLRFEKKLNAVE